MRYCLFTYDRFKSTITSSPTAYPNWRDNAIEELQNDLTAILQETLSHPSLIPQNLTILPGRRSWALYLDVLVLSDNGNIFDAISIAAFSALHDTRIPKTRAIELKVLDNRLNTSVSVDRLAQDTPMDVEDRKTSHFDTQKLTRATDFELVDYWDDGEPLRCRSGSWPLCITLNIVSVRLISS